MVNNAMEQVRGDIRSVLREAGCTLPFDVLRSRVADRSRGPKRRAWDLCEDVALGMTVRNELTCLRIADLQRGELQDGYSLTGLEKPPAGGRFRVFDVDDDDAERFAASLHEASHCVAALALGGVVTVVELKEQGGEDGRFRVGLPKVNGAVPQESVALVMYAGAAGERRFLGNSPRVAAGAADDEKQARRTKLPAAKLAQLREQAARIIERNRGDVLALAASLFAKRRPVFGSQITRLLEQSRRSSNS